MVDPSGTHALPLAARVAQLKRLIAFDRSPVVEIDREELAAILSRYEAMHTALIRALHELGRVPADG